MLSKIALQWITDILKKYGIPFQITGGLAAIAYGATRPLEDIDIDIPEDQFDVFKNDVKEFIRFGPERFKSDRWDLLLMTLNYRGQEIDISGAYDTQILNASTGHWQKLQENLEMATVKNIFGLDLPVIPLEKLIHYKKALARDVDLMDIQEIQNAGRHMI